MPPAQVLQEVVPAALLEAVVGGHDVVEPPQARGHVVCEQNINAVVTPGEQEEDDPEQASEEGGPVEEQVLGGGVCK